MSPGYRFRPLDNELIDCYLRNQIYDVDLYQHSPEYFTSKYKPWGDKEWYFFTPRYRKYRNGRRPNTVAGGVGYWKATPADKQIMSSHATTMKLIAVADLKTLWN
ncbi:NAC domain-containing protein 58-like [Aristolochia californica]|uniref:NAC domain-containing protein 58-like n=1 Tax=Aristolochia californica TaxID=171875 RepID=UPI0035DA14AF